MPFIALAIIFIIAGWRWGDWKHWQAYHSTILFFLLGDIFYILLTSQYPLWQHQPWPPIHSYLGVELGCLVCFTSTTLIYLGLFPNGVGKSIVWIGFWVIIYSLIEVIYVFCDAIKYFNGWNLLYSVLFNMIMFPLLRLHFFRPLLTYMISIPMAIAILVIFKVPIR